jgi:hypothetical protein
MFGPVDVTGTGLGPGGVAPGLGDGAPGVGDGAPGLGGGPAGLGVAPVGLGDPDVGFEAPGDLDAGALVDTVGPVGTGDRGPGDFVGVTTAGALHAMIRSAAMTPKAAHAGVGRERRGAEARRRLMAWSA